jgi:hypothetical protein
MQTSCKKMDITELYKRLGLTINIRENIRKDIISLQTGSNSRSDFSAPRLQALEEEFNRVQQQVIEIDRDIRKSELARARVSS